MAIHKDPSNEFFSATAVNEDTYRRRLPTSVLAPRFYCLAFRRAVQLPNPLLAVLHCGRSAGCRGTMRDSRIHEPERLADPQQTPGHRMTTAARRFNGEPCRTTFAPVVHGYLNHSRIDRRPQCLISQSMHIEREYGRRGTKRVVLAATAMFGGQMLHNKESLEKTTNNKERRMD